MSKYIIDWDSWYVRECIHEDAKRFSGGLYCVYFLEDESGNVFYVGSGKGYRFNSVNPKVRSKEFMEYYNNCRNPHPKIVFFDMNKEQSIEYEKRLIKAFWERGFELVNKDYITRKYGGLHIEQRFGCAI